MTVREQAHRGTWTMEQRAEAVLRELPFELPPGTGALSVTLSYERRAGVLDLGLLGPDGEFRGWSGGARDTFTVTEEWATPGYLPGPLTPGTWRVLMRLHRVPPQGLAYELRAKTLAGPAPSPPDEALPTPVPATSRRPRRALPPLNGAGDVNGPGGADGARWFAGDLHAHTLHSDGSLTLDELARRAAAEGLDFLAVTDHNTTSHHPWLPAASARQGITLLPGQEVTTDLGHANVFGDTGWIDFRAPAGEWLAQAEAGGGVLSVNHPLADDCAWELPFAGPRPRHAEIWHHSWTDRRHGAPLAWARAWSGDRDDVIPLGGSDFHRPDDGRPLGAPTTWILAESAEVPALLDGLRAGRTAVSAGPDAGALLLRYGDEVLALEADGTVLVRPDGGRTVVRGGCVRLPAGEGPHRLETSACEVLALCT
ncbi:CehA/McbA family metallohydrolase [Streptomyces sp. NBC_01795]|uniref:CehA/McbA family metallohydrolase n=1 Tax=unclassified Streptomyces TaxID=2593676 RepID=UPI002DD7EF99|nr:MULTISPECIES: CehA/McbA family metallohydrolase [unclassified Streptomyces]WSA95883.1 CehA/McbA family metallohydrolase [Streptomyces sp. NBC_01795]WSS11491.1 CehA/McbA family metallohydrolase [Streptomyces sp. NBC_01186]